MNRRTRKELLLAMLLALGGCATAGPTPEQQATIGKSIERIGRGTASNSVGVFGREASNDVWTGLGGGTSSKIGAGLINSIWREVQSGMNRP